MDNKNFKLGIVFVTVGSIGWGISGVCGQYLFAEYSVDSSWLTSIRMIFSGIMLLALAFYKEQSGVFNVFKNKADRRWLFAFAILGLLLCQYAFLSAINFSNSGTATVLQSLNVVMMAVIVALQTRTRISLRQGTAIFLAVFGVYLIATNGNPAEMSLSAAALFWGLLSAVGLIIYTLLSRGIIKRWGNTSITGWGMLIGGLVLGIATKCWHIPSNLDFNAFVALAVIVIIGTAVSFSLFLEGVKYIGPVRGTLLGCLEPVSATILAAICLGTKFGIVELIGFAAILTTVFLSISKRT